MNLKALSIIILSLTMPLAASVEQPSSSKIEQSDKSKKSKNYFFAGIGSLIASFIFLKLENKTTGQVYEKYGIIDTDNLSRNQEKDYYSYKFMIKLYEDIRIAAVWGGLFLLGASFYYTLKDKITKNKTSSETQQASSVQTH